ncbi:hypothetical protein N7U66_14945 [Lacinutrix neustonica]|uniref:Uncharacterized protein n=1 Tax=Lacinutrix neustonica TaxID=2980107 RepID=A0A9E8SCI8_9FLAO|nr:hypothetical protein [Lacinutrix neustonica]WAC01353.1 hypothetical protein N7U66_14945 [Lacinutrix neustonica]
MQKQLNQIGLDCAYTDPKRLQKFKEEVEPQFPDGINQSFGITKPKASNDGSPYYKSVYLDSEAIYLGLEEASKGDWKPKLQH